MKAFIGRFTFESSSAVFALGTLDGREAVAAENDAPLLDGD